MKRVLCVAAATALSIALAACNKQTATQIVEVVGPSSTPTPTPTPTASRVIINTVSEVLVAACEKKIGYAASVEPPTAPQDVRWKVEPEASLTPNDATSVTIIIRKSGDYTLTASTPDGKASGSTTVRVSLPSECGTVPPGPGPGPGADTYKVSFQPHGGSGLVGSLVTLRAFCKKNDVDTSCDTATWTTSNASKVDIVGSSNGSTITIRYASVGSADIQVVWQGVNDHATFTGTAEPPLLQPKCTSFTATPSSVASGLDVAIRWTSTNAVRVTGSGDWTRDSLPLNSTDGSEKISPTKNPTRLNLTCWGAPGTTPDTVSLDITVTASVCPNTADYTPQTGTVGVNQSKNLTATVTTAPCNEQFWGLDRPDRAMVAGATGTKERDGVIYPVGYIAVLKGVAPGVVSVFIQPSLTNTSKTRHDWTVTAAVALLSAESDPIPPGMIMFDEVRDASGKITGYRYQGKPVAQTGPPQR